MSEINNLTPEQIARLDDFRRKWFSIALSTDPADRLLAQQGVKQAYTAANLDPPVVFVWLRSPVEGYLAAALCEVWAPGGLLPRTPRVATVRDKVWGSVVARLGDQAWSSVTKQVCKQVKDDVYGQLGQLVATPVCAQVWAQLGDHISNRIGPNVTAHIRNQFWSALVENEALDNVWEQLRSQVRAQVGSQIGAQISRRLGGDVIREVCFELNGHECLGQHAAGGLSFYDYFRTVFGVLAADRVAGLIQIAECCGWWWPYRGLAILTERPFRLSRDSRGRLHNENALALEYPDGWGVYALHGVAVPKKYIETPADLIDPTEVLRERNAAIRAAVMSKIGFQRIVRKLKYRIISKANGNSLIEFHFGNLTVRALPLVWVDKHGEKETILPVPRTREQFGYYPDNINDCEQVRRWTLGWSKEADVVSET
jgi:Domain of unknown function (DUF6745)